MANTVTTTNVIKLKFALYNEETEDAGSFTISLKNPLTETQSEEMITKATELNSLLAGSLHGIWFGDKLLENHTVEKITKIDTFEQTKTVSEDGKTTRTVSQQKEIFNSPYIPTTGD